MHANAALQGAVLGMRRALDALQADGLLREDVIAETGSETLLGSMMTIAVVRALGPDLTGLIVAARLAWPWLAGELPPSRRRATSTAR